MAELKQDDSVRSSVVLSFAVFIIISVPIWWASSYSFGQRDTPFIRELDIEKNRIITVNYVALNDDIELRGLERGFSRVDLNYDTIDEHPEAANLPLSGSFADFMNAFKELEEPPLGTYNIFAVTQNDFDFTGFHGALNELRRCSRNQVVVLASTVDKERLQEFQNRLGAELSLTMKEPVFGLDNELPIRFTLLAIGDAAIKMYQFKQDFEEHFKMTLSSLDPLIQTKVTFQTRLMQSFAEEPQIGDQKVRFFSETQLTTLMRSGAWNLDLTIKKVNSINFVVIFTEDGSPVFVKENNGHLSTSFIYPNWGGAFFWNARETEGPGKYFSGSLLEILGLNVPENCNGIEPIDQDRFLLNILQANIHRATNAHSAFNELLVKSPFIEINENLRTHLNKWHKSTVATQKALDDGNLCASVKISSNNAANAEDAFYHPSLMGKMYFPDEHKYAVYMPLLLPTLLQVVSGLLKIFAGYVKQRRFRRAAP